MLMQQKINIKKKIIQQENNECVLYIVPAISLKNSDNQVKLLVPHPTGNYAMEFSTVEEAASAIKKAGFEYNLPNGEIIKNETVDVLANKTSAKSNLENILFNKFKAKINDINPSIVSSAITALSYLEDTNAIDIYINKLGEDNEKIRAAAMDALVNSQMPVVDKLIDTLTNQNWVSRNSAITCLTKISEYTDIEPEKILVPIINRIDDENTIVQANAILSAGKIYRNCIKRQEK